MVNLRSQQNIHGEKREKCCNPFHSIVVGLFHKLLFLFDPIFTPNTRNTIVNKIPNGQTFPEKRLPKVLRPIITPSAISKILSAAIYFSLATVMPCRITVISIDEKKSLPI
jgi:hypothetical protein